MPNSEHSDITNSLRKRVFKLLNKYPDLKPQDICTQLGENYQSRGQVVTQYKKQWKKEYKSEQGSIRSMPDELHNAFYKGSLGGGVVGVLRLLKMSWPMGWKSSRARNKYLIFKNGLGRVRLFENGTVELWVKKPASDGKCMQLFSQAFVWTKLIDSIQMVEAFQATLMRRFHAIFDTGERGKYMKITAFSETHKFVFAAHDKSHPTCYEFMVEYHAEVESARRLFDLMENFFNQFTDTGKGVRSKDKRLYE